MAQQCVQAGLAATKIEAARLLTYQAAYLKARGRRTTLESSMAKLYASEMAGRVVDRCVQVLGGRGYMRTFAAERFLRELRVDRIWEGTSEIQRLIIARGLEKRGVERMLDVEG